MHRHEWGGPTPAMMEDDDNRLVCRSRGCGARRDEAKSRKARSSVRMGKDNERRLERVYGPTKVGERGDAVDLVGNFWKWQSKASRADVPAKLRRIMTIEALDDPPDYILKPLYDMAPLYPMLSPLLVRSFVRQGLPTRDFIYVPKADWLVANHVDPSDALEQTNGNIGLYVMTGEHFRLSVGRDEW